MSDDWTFSKAGAIQDAVWAPLEPESLPIPSDCIGLARSLGLTQGIGLIDISYDSDGLLFVYEFDGQVYSIKIKKDGPAQK